MPTVSIDSLQKSFGGVVALDHVSFTVEPGEVFGIVGPNGAGKTTTVECIAGTIEPDQGSVTVLGVDPALERAYVRQRVGYQLQSTALPVALRVGEAIELFASFYESPVNVAELLHTVGLSEHRRRPFGTLSGGQKQRLSIALALVGDPSVAVFDELTTGLDPQGRRDIWALIERINDEGITVILVTHFLEEAERLCDRLAVIDQGRTRFVGSPHELLAAMGTDLSSSTRLEDAYLQLLDGNSSTGRKER